MYYALYEGKMILTERLRWVKLQTNGIYINCAESEGQGIVLGGEIYHVAGREEIDKPTVDLIWQNDVTLLKEFAEAQEADQTATELALAELAELVIGGAT
jgi:ligand-binding sensor protein